LGIVVVDAGRTGALLIRRVANRFLRQESQNLSFGTLWRAKTISETVMARIEQK